MTGDRLSSKSSLELNQKLDSNVALDAAGLGVWDLNSDTGLLNLDTQCLQLFHIDAAHQLSYADFKNFIYPADIARLDELFQQATDDRFSIILRIVGDDKLLRRIELKGRSFLGETGQVIRVTGIAQQVSNQQPVNRQAETEHDHFRELVEQVPVAMALLSGPQFVITLANERVLAYWGKQREDVINKSFFEAMPDVTSQGIDELLQKIYTSGERSIAKESVVILNQNGITEPTSINFICKPFWQDDHITGVLVVCSDATEQVLTRPKNPSNEYADRSLMDTLPAIIWTTEPDGSCSYLNRQWYDYTGQTQAEAEKFGWLDAIHPDDRESSATRFLEANEKHISFDLLYRLRQCDGTYRWAIDKASPRFDNYGQYLGMIGSVVDVHEQKLAEEALRASESKLRSIVSTAPVAIGLFIGRDLVIESPNQTFIDIVGKGPDIVGKPLREVMPELITENQPFLQILDDVFTTGQMFQSYGSQVSIVQNGVMTHKIYNISYSPLFDSDGNVYAILDLAVDVTGEAKARQALKENQNILQSMINMAEMGSYSINLETNQLVKSQRVASWYGLPEVTDVATSISMIQESDQQRVSQLFADALLPSSDGSYQMEYTVINAQTNQKHILQTVGQVRRGLEGQPTHVDGLVWDITSQHELQLALEQLVQQRTEELALTNEELASTNDELAMANQAVTEVNSQLQTLVNDLKRSNQNLEQFAYIASHDLQEPLRKIQSFSSLLQQQFGPELGPTGLDLLQRLANAGSRMSILIRDLLTFSRIATEQVRLSPVALNQIVQESLDNLSLLVEETDALITVDPLPTVQGDVMQLGQLFSNLLSNALKFHKPGEVPQISISAVTVTGASLPTELIQSRPSQRYHRITVSDNGVGFDEKYLDRIFQVFQRLHGKNEFAGTGVGLAICQKVVTNHGGILTASSQTGQGATFIVYLPLLVPTNL
ncbi:PAS domain-containing sensor histidine kinase [Spirosoma oryzicola]|uniref:PAS domain-containing sensor histidine kinase n=1 Tax=Spirosoma oryzicola TaxID=2898794 RepID=UPI001E3593B9|nr:PAS domain-containing sensor histidine kinase [Spirosoma oryzicola]UHG94187.1 PAS domain S-box protein [Spirosoma oryzicola]